MIRGQGCCAPARGGPPPGAAGGLRPARETGWTGWVAIPGGTALVGTDRPVLPVDGEAPLRKVRVRPFRMDAGCVTNARFAAFVEATGHVTEAERLGDSFVFETFLPPALRDAPRVATAPWWRMVPGATWRAPHGPGSEDAARPDAPVTQVSWNDAVAFADWAGGRLPTEPEWEHAARGGLGDIRFPWGDREPDETAFLPCNIWQGTFPTADTGADGYRGPAPSHSFAPNGYGLYNMVGNVWEWTASPFKVRSLRKSVIAAHKGKEGWRLTKGGSFLCHDSYCYRYRIAARGGNAPDSATCHQGLRLVYDP